MSRPLACLVLCLCGLKLLHRCCLLLLLFVSHQAWLSSIETVPSVGLGSEYFDTPAKYVAYCFLGIVGLLVAGFFSQH